MCRGQSWLGQAWGCFVSVCRECYQQQATEGRIQAKAAALLRCCACLFDDDSRKQDLKKQEAAAAGRAEEHRPTFPFAIALQALH